MHEVRGIKQRGRRIEATSQVPVVQRRSLVHVATVSLAAGSKTSTLFPAIGPNYGIDTGPLHRFDIRMQVRPFIDAMLCHGGRLLRDVDASIMPLRCVFCGTRSQFPEKRVCRACLADLPRPRNACARCARPTVLRLPEGVHCAACQRKPPPFDAAVAPLLYEFPVDAALKALKFGRRLYYAAAFAELLLDELPRLAPDIDALLPVPLHWRRQAWRGFNQAAELCKPLAKACALPLMPGVVRHRATAFQSGLPAASRRRNLDRAFTVKKTPTARHVLIVDDVVTTAATTHQLGSALLRAGVERVSVLAVARAK